MVQKHICCLLDYTLEQFVQRGQRYFNVASGFLVVLFSDNTVTALSEFEPAMNDNLTDYLCNYIFY